MSTQPQPTGDEYKSSPAVPNNVSPVRLVPSVPAGRTARARMSILTPAAARDLRDFATRRGPTMLSKQDEVHPERWDRMRYAGLNQFRARNGISELPSKLSRADIFEQSRRVIPDVPTVFLWTMQWGYQSEGTGAYRTDVALSSRNRVPAEIRLASIFAKASQGDLSGAFSLMRGSGSRVRNMNTSFGTKFLYFAGYDETNALAGQPLILDKRVASALYKVLGNPSDIPSTFKILTTCTYDHYRWYIDTAAKIRDDYVPGERIDLVEFWLWSHS